MTADLELQSQETEALLKTSERPKKRALAIQIIALCGGAALAGAALPAPTPHHHHHDGAVAEFRDAALGSLVVAALTAAVLI